jgi:PAS domain S-box-containing protein
VQPRNDHSPSDIFKWDSRVRTLLIVILIGTLCYGAARLGEVLSLNGPQKLWPLWPGCAMLVGACLISPRKNWPILILSGLAGFAVYDLQAGVSAGAIGWLLLADTLEILVAIFGVSYFLHGLPLLNSLEALAKYSLFTVILGSIVVSLIGMNGLTGDRWVSWRMSFLSEALAFLTVTPCILGWAGHIRAEVRPPPRYYLEAGALLGAILTLSYVTFSASESSSQPALLYSLVPFLLWAALRFGSTGVSTSATIIAMMAIWGDVHGLGPFRERQAIPSVTGVQLFLLATTVPFIVLAVLVEEHKQAERVLRESEKRFRLMADSAPSLIWVSGTHKLRTFFNQRWLEFTGRSMEQEVGNGWVSGVHREDVEKCIGPYSAAFDARLKFEMEYRLRRNDGEYRWILDYGVPRFEPDENFCGYIGSCIDITERKALEESLHGLTGRLFSAQEEERSRIARDLHDDFSQRMVLLILELEELSQMPPVSESVQLGSVLKMLTDTRELATDLHALSHELHSSKLEHVGLISALNGLCREIGEKHQIEVLFLSGECPHTISKEVALCLFRVTQEALANVIKHSETKNARVELTSNEHGIQLRITDSGKGFVTGEQNPSPGIGMIGMRERLRLVGGRLFVRSEPLKGTEIVAEVPLASPAVKKWSKAMSAGE